MDPAAPRDRESRLPLGVMLLVAFFWFGAAMCLLTLALLTFPDGALAPLWQIKPRMRADFQSLGVFAFGLMAVVGLACGLSAIGLARGALWGRRLAVAVLALNLMGDAASACVGHDYRALIGLPIGGLMIAYLIRRRARVEWH